MNKSELEYRLLYSMVVAGKSASFAEGVLGRLFGDKSLSPFAWLRRMRSAGMLGKVLREARSGNYGKLEKGFSELIDKPLDLATAVPAQLETIHGIGPKTSRFFIIWTRDAKHAALDTHVLKWLRFIGHDAPKATPSGEKYAALETVILAEADARGVTPRELDAQIWDWCASGKHKDGQWPANLQPR